MNEGRVGRDWYPVDRRAVAAPEDIRIVAVHHHLVSIPGTGRERNIVFDAGDLLHTLVGLDVDVILSGQHVPLGPERHADLQLGNGRHARLRASTPPSWNEVHVDATTVKVFIHYQDGRRDLAAVFSRKTRSLTREAFYVTEDFLTVNQVTAT